MINPLRAFKVPAVKDIYGFSVEDIETELGYYMGQEGQIKIGHEMAIKILCRLDESSHLQRTIIDIAVQAYNGNM